MRPAFIHSMILIRFLFIGRVLLSDLSGSNGLGVKEVVTLRFRVDVKFGS